MLRLWEEYPVNNDKFEWNWFATLQFPVPTTLRNVGKVLLQ
jgi:hypothetical protein